MLANELEKVEAELASRREALEELSNQAELGRRNNEELALESASLELKATEYRQSIAAIEAELQEIQNQLVERNSALDAMTAEELKLEMRIANLLTQTSKLDCLAVATSETDTYAKELQQAEQERFVVELQNQKLALEDSIMEIKLAIDFEKETAMRIADEASQSQSEADKSVADAQRRVEMLTAKSESLADEVQNLSTELFALKQDSIELRAEIRDLEAAHLELKEVEQELESLKLQLVDQRSQIADATAQIAAYDATYQTRSLAADAIEQQISNLESHLQMANSQQQERLKKIAQLTAEQEELLAQNQHLVEQNNDLAFAIRQLHNAKTDISRQLDELRENARLQSEKVSQLEAERAVLEDHIAELTASMQTLVLQRNDLESEIELLQELGQQRSAMEEDIENLSSNIQTLSQQQTTALEMAALKEQALAETETQLQALKDEFNVLEQKLEQTVALKARTEEVLATITQLQQTADDEYALALGQATGLQQRICELQTQLDSINTARANASANLQQTIDEVSDAQSVAKQWSTYIDSLKLEVESNRKIQSELERAIAALRKGESQAMLDMERASTEVESLLEQQAHLKSSNQAEENALRAARRANDEAAQMQTNLQHEILGAESMLAEVSRQLSASNAELQRAEESVNAAINTQATLENQILDRQATLERVTAEHENHSNRVRELVEEQAFLETSIIGLNKQIAKSESVIVSLESQKHELELDLRQQQSTLQIALDQQATIETALAKLNDEITAKQGTKAELAKIETDCIHRTETLNALCEESALEQARLEDLKEQIAAAQRLLDELTERKTDVEVAYKQLEQETYLLKQALAQASEELQDHIEAKDAASKLIEDFNLELQRFAIEKASVEANIRGFSEQLNTKLVALHKTEDEISSAETKALDLWSTISELQDLGAQLDKTLDTKREAVAHATEEIIKLQQTRESLLAQQDALDTSVTTLTLEAQACQASKLNLDQEIVTLTAEVNRLQAEIATANAELALLAKKAIEASAIELKSTDLLSALETQVEETDSKSDKVKSVSWGEAVSESVHIEKNELTQTMELSQETDIWTSLGEIARLGNIRIDTANIDTADEFQETPSSAIPSSDTPRNLEPIVGQEKLGLDAWDTVLAPLTAQRRA